MKKSIVLAIMIILTLSLSSQVFALSGIGINPTPNMTAEG